MVLVLPEQTRQRVRGTMLLERPTLREVALWLRSGARLILC